MNPVDNAILKANALILLAIARPETNWRPEEYNFAGYRRTTASSRAGFGAFLDRLQPHSPDQGASWINHAPVLAELAARRWVGSKHTCLRRNHASVRSRFFDQEVHRRQRETGRAERFKVVGGWLLAWPPACGGAHQRTDNDLVARLISKQKKARPQSDIQNWLVLRRVQNAWWSCAPETASPGERPQKLDLSRSHLTDRLVDALFGRVDLNRMGFAELIDRCELIQLRLCRRDPRFARGKNGADYEN